MRNARFRLAVAALTALPPMAAAQEIEAVPDLPALIECRADMHAWGSLAFSLMEGSAAADALGWKERASDSLFLREYELPAAIVVFGRPVRRIALTATGPMAMLEGVDPAALASQFGVEPTISSPDKFLGEKVIAERREEDGGTIFHSRIALNLSTVVSHPGLTIVGCSYALETSQAQ